MPVLFLSRVSAGFPSPADDYIEQSLDLNTHLVDHPAATFFLHVSGDSMTGAGIFDGDLLIVDRSLNPENGSVVIAVIEGELTVKRFFLEPHRVELRPENPAYPSLFYCSETEITIWGVVSWVIHAP